MPTPKRSAKTTLYIRGIDASTARAIKSAARMRGLTLGQYLHRLALLHAAIREIADLGPCDARDILAKLGLVTVTE